MIHMWFTGINCYKLAVEKDRDSIFTTIFLEHMVFGVYSNSSRRTLSTRSLDICMQCTAHFSCEQALWLC
jgi:hypothetical protein